MNTSSDNCTSRESVTDELSEAGIEKRCDNKDCGVVRRLGSACQIPDGNKYLRDGWSLGSAVNKYAMLVGHASVISSD